MEYGNGGDGGWEGGDGGDDDDDDDADATLVDEDFGPEVGLQRALAVPASAFEWLDSLPDERFG